MPIYQKTISTTSDELGFVKSLYDNFKEISGVVITPENPNDLFGADSPTYYEFVVDYKDVSIKFKRASVSYYTDSNAFEIKIINGDMITFSKWQWEETHHSKTEIATRTLKFTLIDSLYGIEMFFADYNQMYFQGDSLILIPYGSSYLYANNSSAHSLLSSLTFYKLNEVEPYSFARNFNFMLPENGVKLIPFTSLLNTNGDLIADLQGLISCSIVPNHSVLTINNKRYFSLGQDVLIEV